MDKKVKEFETQSEKLVSLGYQLCQRCYPQPEDKKEPVPMAYKALCALILTAQQALNAFASVLRSLKK